MAHARSKIALCLLALLICAESLVAQQLGPQRLPLEPPEPSLYAPSGSVGALGDGEEEAVSGLNLNVMLETDSDSPSSPAFANADVDSRYSLSDLEGLAVAANPALAEGLSRIQAAKGRALQVSLPPNPTVGYTATEIGNDGSAGQHGAFWSRTFIRGNKLEWNHAVQCREVRRLEQAYHVLRERILTDVRTHFYEILLLQQRSTLLTRILNTNNQATTIAKKLFDAGENTKNDVLLLELEAEQTSTDIMAIEAQRTAKWRGLARLVGEPMLGEGPLAAPHESFDLQWEEAVSLMQQSPVLATVHAEIERNRAALQRARVEPIPDLTAQLSWNYDFSTDDTFTGIQLGMNLPRLNRNSGGIYEANANVRASLQKVERVRLAIEQRLAAKFGDYDQAQRQLGRIDKVIVPKAEELVKIALASYAAGESSLADVLNAQRSLLRSLVRQLDARQQVRLSYIAIQGFLLSGGLSAE